MPWLAQESSAAFAAALWRAAFARDRDVRHGRGSIRVVGRRVVAGAQVGRDNRDFGTIEQGLRTAGFSAAETARIMRENWLSFFDENFGPA